MFVNEPRGRRFESVVAATGISAVQLHGDEPPAFAAALGVPLLRSVTLDDVDEARGDWPSDTTFLLDAADVVRRGGTGKTVDWDERAGVARRRTRRPCRRSDARERRRCRLRLVRPFGVDVSSGVEESPGVKDA